VVLLRDDIFGLLLVGGESNVTMPCIQNVRRLVQCTVSTTPNSYHHSHASNHKTMDRKWSCNRVRTKRTKVHASSIRMDSSMPIRSQNPAHAIAADLDCLRAADPLRLASVSSDRGGTMVKSPPPRRHLRLASLSWQVDRDSAMRVIVIVNHTKQLASLACIQPQNHRLNLSLHQQRDGESRRNPQIN
jgi:hypothetical protein